MLRLWQVGTNLLTFLVIAHSQAVTVTRDSTATLTVYCLEFGAEDLANASMTFWTQGQSRAFVLYIRQGDKEVVLTTSRGALSTHPQALFCGQCLSEKWVKVKVALSPLELCWQSQEGQSCESGASASISQLNDSQLRPALRDLHIHLAKELTEVAPRHLQASHVTRFGHRRYIHPNEVQYVTVVNNNLSTYRITLGLSLQGAPGSFSLGIYKPYPSCLIANIPSLLSYSAAIYSSTSGIATCGGLKGTYTFKITAGAVGFRYFFDYKVECHDDGSGCFCSSGSYPDSFLNSCAACPSNSYECGNYHALGCMPGYPSAAPVPEAFDCRPCLSTDGLQRSTGACLACDLSCNTCEAPSDSTQCTSCFPRAYLAVPAPSRCLCEPGYFPLPDTGNCEPCASSCNACVDSVLCTACKPGATLLANPGQCVCAPPSLGTPELCCHSSCQMCTGPASTDCLTCRANAVLSSNLCICVAGFYQSGGECVSCSDNCLSCISASECADCHALATVRSGQCECESDAFPDPDAAHCTRCSFACASCTSATQCLSCRPGAVLANSACVCSAGYFASSGECWPCSSLCRTCLDADRCVACWHNAQLTGSSCECVSGFFLAESECAPCRAGCRQCTADSCTECEEGYRLLGTACVACTSCEAAQISLQVTRTNSLIVSFTKPMKLTLTRHDISVTLSNCTQTDFTWKSPSFDGISTVEIVLVFESDPEGCVVHLNFLCPLFDVNGVAAERKELCAPLRSARTPHLDASAAVQGALAVTAVTSLAGGGSGFLSLLNNLQLLSYIAMSRLPIPAHFAAALQASNIGLMVSNPLSTLLSLPEASPPGFIDDYGIHSLVFFANCSAFLAAGALTLCQYVILRILSHLLPTRTSLTRSLETFHWGVPIQLTLTSYLDVCILSLLQIRYIRDCPVSTIAEISLAVSFVLFSSCVLLPPVLFAFVRKHLKCMTTHREPAFSSRWGALFLHLTTHSSSATYYCVFTARRLVLAATLLLSDHDLALLCACNCAVATAVRVTQTFAYVASYRPFVSRLQQAQELIVEGSVVATYALVSSFLIPLSTRHEEVLDSVGVWTVRAAIVGNATCGLLRAAEVIRMLLKDFRAKGKVVI